MVLSFNQLNRNRVIEANSEDAKEFFSLSRKTMHKYQKHYVLNRVLDLMHEDF